MKLCVLAVPSEKEIARFYKDIKKQGVFYPVARAALHRGCTLVIPVCGARYYLFEMRGREIIYGIFSGEIYGVKYHVYFNGVVNPRRFLCHADI